MRRFSHIWLLVLLACRVFAQTPDPSANGVIWEPPTWNFLDNVVPKATVPKEMLATVRVSGLLVTLEKTNMQDVAKSLGGTFGGKGDAGEALQWLCFRGADRTGSWVLWLESGEINGGTVGSFQWQRLNKNAAVDARCQMLRDAKVVLPSTVSLSITEAEVRKSLGMPTLEHGDQLIYVHEHEESIRGEPFTSINIVAILLRDGRVWAIDVSKTTSS